MLSSDFHCKENDGKTGAAHLIETFLAKTQITVVHHAPYSPDLLILGDIQIHQVFAQKTIRLDTSLTEWYIVHILPSLSSSPKVGISNSSFVFLLLLFLISQPHHFKFIFLSPLLTFEIFSNGYISYHIFLSFF